MWTVPLDMCEKPHTITKSIHHDLVCVRLRAFLTNIIIIIALYLYFIMSCRIYIIERYFRDYISPSIFINIIWIDTVCMLAPDAAFYLACSRLHSCSVYCTHIFCLYNTYVLYYYIYKGVFRAASLLKWNSCASKWL